MFFRHPKQAHLKDRLHLLLYLHLVLWHLHLVPHHLATKSQVISGGGDRNKALGVACQGDSLENEDPEEKRSASTERLLCPSEGRNLNR